jgi:hypothetical protein
MEELEPLLAEIWQSRILSNGGPILRRFEAALAAYLEVEHLSIVTNASLGLPRAPIPGYARIRRLTIYSDQGQSGCKLRRYRTLRRRLRAGAVVATGPPGVFLRRGTDGEPRRLVNEEALADRLAARGFDIIDPGALDAAEIVARTLDARMVVAVEGSHLSHALHTLADGGAWLVIQPPDRFALPYKEFADCLGMSFGFLVGSPEAGGFAVDLDEIDRMVDLLP